MDVKKIELTRDEMNHIKSLIKPERPLCWFCIYRPDKPKEKKYCKITPSYLPWKEAAKKKACYKFQPDGNRIGLRKEETPEAREQLRLWQ